jgi:hypothetical protein
LPPLHTYINSCATYDLMELLATLARLCRICSSLQPSPKLRKWPVLHTFICRYMTCRKSYAHSLFCQLYKAFTKQYKVRSFSLMHRDGLLGTCVASRPLFSIIGTISLGGNCERCEGCIQTRQLGQHGVPFPQPCLCMRMVSAENVDNTLRTFLWSQAAHLQDKVKV